MGFSQQFEAEVLDHYFGGGNPATLWIAVHVGVDAPGKDGSGWQEPTDAAYARIEVVNDETSWAVAVPGNPTVKANAVTWDFPTALEPWGRVTHVGIFDDEFGLVPRTIHALPQNSDGTFGRDVTANDTVSIPAGLLRVRMSVQ